MTATTQTPAADAATPAILPDARSTPEPQPLLDPRTGEPLIDPDTGEQMMGIPSQEPVPVLDPETGEEAALAAVSVCA